MNTFVMNRFDHYFEIDTQQIIVSSKQFDGCSFFKNEDALHQAVCSKTGSSLDEVKGFTFFITKKDGLPVLFDDRSIPNEIDGPVETFVSEFML
ncbi:hypothetical protein V2K54_25950 [Pseudomonas alliivorans]|nr:hypothetical protein [Pseudomonas alliivorans]